MFTVRSGYRPGQVLLLSYLSFLALAAVLVTVAERIHQTVLAALTTERRGDTDSPGRRISLDGRQKKIFAVGAVLMLATTGSAAQFVSQPQSGVGVVENSVVVDGVM